MNNANQLESIKDELRVKFDQLIESNNLDYKDELKILQMLTQDVSNQLVGTVTIVAD